MKTSLAALLLASTLAHAYLEECTIGEVAMFAGQFAPRNWALCDGQYLSIAQNTTLFAILGTTYGGDGMTTFRLPDLRGRFPMHKSSSRPLGSTGGAETVTLTSQQMPAHNHALYGTTNTSESKTPSGNYVAASPAGRSAPLIYSPQLSATQMGAQSVGISGGSQPHENMPPYLGINFIICIQGYFPSQN